MKTLCHTSYKEINRSISLDSVYLTNWETGLLMRSIKRGTKKNISMYKRKKIFCTNNHAMKKINEKSDKRICDEIKNCNRNKTVKGKNLNCKVYHCKTCNYTLCSECYNSKKVHNIISSIIQTICLNFTKINKFTSGKESSNRKYIVALLISLIRSNSL